MTICGSLFCLLITYQKDIQHPHGYFDNFHFAIIIVSVLLPLALMFTLILKCTTKSICCGVVLSNVQHFDINKWDVIEGENPEQHVEIHIRNVAQDTSVYYSVGTVLWCCGVVKCVSDINELDVKEDELSKNKDELSKQEDELSENKDELSEHKKDLEMREFLASNSVMRKMLSIPDDFM